VWVCAGVCVCVDVKLIHSAYVSVRMVCICIGAYVYWCCMI